MRMTVTYFSTMNLVRANLCKANSMVNDFYRLYLLGNYADLLCKMNVDKYFNSFSINIIILFLAFERWKDGWAFILAVIV